MSESTPSASRPRPVRKRVDLPSHTPALDHHRPGGAQLFGTAMGIDMILRNVVACPMRDTTIIVEDLEILVPCIVPDGASRQLVIEAEAMAERRGRPPIKARLYTSQHPEDTHFTATIRLGNCSGKPPGPAEISRLASPKAVKRKDIYKAFFHGDTFQVIADAVFTGNAVATRYRADEIPIRISQIARLIEFGLQTCGLLEIALSGTNKIPNRVRRIALSPRTIFRCQRSALARAQRAAASDAADIDVYDETGHLALSISGYETTALPFAHDRVPVEQLQALLQQSNPDI